MMRNSSMEILALERQQLRQRGAAAGLVARHDHLPHRADALGVEEHVLGAAQADALGAELARRLGVERRFGVGAHAQAARRRPPSPSAWRNRRTWLGSIIGDRADEHLAGGAVEGDGLAGAHGLAAGGQRLRVVVDRDAAGAGDAGPAHAARHHRGVAGHAAARGQDAAGGVHAVDVLRAGLDPHQDHRLALGGAAFGLVGAEHDGAGGRAGAGRQALGQQRARRLRDRASGAATGRAPPG